MAACETCGFPDDWIGRWTGPLKTLGGSSLAPATMTIEIAPLAANRWSWRIVYDGEAGRQVRPYELVAVDAAAGRYAIDEKNGIVLPVRYIQGTLYSSFEVMGSRIEVRESLSGVGGDAAILVEMATTAVAEVAVTGGIAADSIPEVRGWVPRSVQRARLSRQ